MANEDRTVLEIKDLYVQYNTDDAVVHAVNGLNLTLKEGEKLGLVGETGAGKTTLALSILKLLPDKVGEIRSGSIIYKGDDLVNKPESFMLGLRGQRMSEIRSLRSSTSISPISRPPRRLLRSMRCSALLESLLPERESSRTNSQEE